MLEEVIYIYKHIHTSFVIDKGNFMLMTSYAPILSLCASDKVIASVMVHMGFEANHHEQYTWSFACWMWGYLDVFLFFVDSFWHIPEKPKTWERVQGITFLKGW